jgi:helix-turn-helix protein
MTQQRSRTPEPPYCWQSKAARRMIYEYFDGDTFGASCLGVYAALTEIASDKEAETFTTPQSYIAQKSCLGLSTVKKALKELRSLGLLAYETPRLRGSITFTLVATRPTLATTRPTLAKVRFRRDLATVEEHIEEHIEEQREESLASAPESSLSASATESAPGKKSAPSISVAGLDFADRFRRYARR